MVLSTILSLPKSISKQTSSTHNTSLLIIVFRYYLTSIYKRLHFHWILSHPIELMMWKLIWRKKKFKQKKGIFIVVCTLITTELNITFFFYRKKNLFNRFCIDHIPLYTSAILIMKTTKKKKIFIQQITCYAVAIRF